MIVILVSVLTNITISMPTKKPAHPGESRQRALMTLSTSLAALHRGYRAAVDKAVAHVGLSHALAWPLVMIGRHGAGPRPGVLANMLGIEGPSLVRSLAQLREAGLIEHREDAADRRAKTLHLTPAGVAASVRIEAVLNEFRKNLFEGVSDDDVAVCLRVFAMLEQRLGRAATQSGVNSGTTSEAA